MILQHSRVEPESGRAEARLEFPFPGSLAYRAFAVKVVPKRRPDFPFSGFDLYHHFRNDAFYGLYNLLKVQKTGKREVVLGQPLPQTLYPFALLQISLTISMHVRIGFCATVMPCRG